jgi:myo-inositol 2-dehydrogenase/D-chiro-inositol 1-dehydrogenase
MATQKYRQPSPYTVPIPPAPPEDAKNTQHEQNLKLSPVKDHSRFGFALFGVGRAGTIHLSFLVKDPHVELLYVVDDDQSKWDKLRKYWNLERVKFLKSSDAAAVYQDAKVRAVVVASPTRTHENIVSKALDHKKAVFCEKPVAENYDKTKALYEKARKMQQPLFSAFNRRFDPSFAAVRNRVRGGEVGKVLTVKVCSRDSPLPSLDYLRTSGGIFHDCAVHDIDMTLYVMGEYPTRVTAAASANIPEIAGIGDHDTVGILFTFGSGAVSMVDLSRQCSYGYEQRLEVFGEKGMIKAENQQPIHNVESYTGRSVVKAPIAYSFPSRYAEGYELEMLHFLDVLRGRTQVSVDSRDVLAVSKIATACEESIRKGSTVELKWSQDELPLIKE